MKRALFFLTLLLPVQVFAQFVVSGTITDWQSGEPIEEVIVRLEGQKKPVFTAEDGKYSFDNVADGEYLIAVDRLGYEDYQTQITISGNTVHNVKLVIKPSFNEEVIVSAVRAGQNTPTTYTNISAKEIEEENLGQDIPYLIDQTPSAVSTSDAGTGFGYTGIRIRGTDATRINVTINGIPYNDAESQGTFWVDLPDIATSTDNIQIQRGVGTSTNGAAAFGATISLKTTGIEDKPYAELSNAFGSFNTRKHSLAVGTGLINNHFFANARVSRINSDGYIDRGFADLSSYYLSGGYKDENTILSLNVFSGHEVTYQSWYGVYEEDLEENRTYNVAGTDYGAKEEPHDNEVDDYKQDHYQLLLSQELSDKWIMNAALHLTRGKGFFEQYKVDDGLAGYGLSPLYIGGDTISSSDIIRRRWLDNYFWGTVASLKYNSANLDLTIGGGWNQYDGQHYGEIIWAQYASDSEYGERYYNGNGLKTDFNIYTKAEYSVSKKLTLFGDLQYRFVSHQVDGTDNDQRQLYENETFNFFNPKAGLSFAFNSRNSAYASFSVANREPNRDDLINAPAAEDAKPETLYDIEAGYTHQGLSGYLKANLYYMMYKDQLVLTGRLDDVGNPIRQNVDNSYRAGIELDGALQLTPKWAVAANATFSINKIKAYNEYVYTYDESYTPVDSLTLVTPYENTDIAFSPQVVAAAELSYEPVKNLKLSLIGKYVGKQYLDNTSSDEKSLDAYFTTDFRLNYSLYTDVVKEIAFTLMVRNITDAKYESNGYTFSERYVGPGYLTEPVVYNYYYPQAGINFLAGLSLRF